MKIVMTIAGSDSSAGAGIQQDLKTITHMGCYGATVITAITAQNTKGVSSVMPVPAEVVRAQMEAVLSDLHVDAIKIGMIPNREVAVAVTLCLMDYMQSVRGERPHIVLDPVMISTSGTRLMSEECISYVRENLMPMCTLVTPNLPEAEVLPPPYPTAFLVKGGHGSGEELVDTLYCIDGSSREYRTQRIESTNLHGTGCTLSSAIACALAKGLPLTDAVEVAKEEINTGIKGGRNLNIGKGNGPLWLF